MSPRPVCDSVSFRCTQPCVYTSTDENDGRADDYDDPQIAEAVVAVQTLMRSCGVVAISEVASGMNMRVPEFDGRYWKRTVLTISRGVLGKEKEIVTASTPVC